MRQRPTLPSSVLVLALAVMLIPQAPRLTQPQPVEPPRVDVSPPPSPGEIDQQRLMLLEVLRNAFNTPPTAVPAPR